MRIEIFYKIIIIIIIIIVYNENESGNEKSAAPAFSLPVTIERAASLSTMVLRETCMHHCCVLGTDVVCMLGTIQYGAAAGVDSAPRCKQLTQQSIATATHRMQPASIGVPPIRGHDVVSTPWPRLSRFSTWPRVKCLVCPQRPVKAMKEND